MDASMWVAKTGLDAQQTRMNVISNNLANVNTTGFKRDRAVFEDLLYQNIRQAGGQTGANTQSPTGLMLGTGVRVVSTEKQHAQGNMVNTQNPLDMAIAGEGFSKFLSPMERLLIHATVTSSCPIRASLSLPPVHFCSLPLPFLRMRLASHSVATVQFLLSWLVVVAHKLLDKFSWPDLSIQVDLNPKAKT